MREPSFSQRLRAGWTQQQLMKYYALTDSQYDKVMKSQEEIEKKGKSYLSENECDICGDMMTKAKIQKMIRTRSKTINNPQKNMKLLGYV